MATVGIGGKTPVSQLQEYLAHHEKTIPQYELIHSSTGVKVWFKYQLSLSSITVVGEGASKKDAKHNCAKAMLIRLGISPTANGIVTTNKDQDSKESFPKGHFNAIGSLNEFCVKHRYPTAQYSTIREEGPPHKRVFTVKCSVGAESETAIANTKQEAKHTSAGLLLQKMGALSLNLNTPQRASSSQVEVEEIQTYSPEEVKEIIKKFKATSYLIKSKSTTTNKTDLHFKDYHHATKLDENFKSSSIDSLVCMKRTMGRATFDVHVQFNFDILLEQILRELSLSSEFILIPSRKASSTILTLMIDYKIPLSFLGVGDTRGQAKVMASTEAINWFVNLHS